MNMGALFSVFSNIKAIAVGALLIYVPTTLIELTTPIVSDMHVVNWEITKTHILANVVGRKNRKECAPVENTPKGYIQVGKNELWEEVPFRFVPNGYNDKMTSRPARVQNFGVWEWNKLHYKPVTVMMRIGHICEDRPDIIYTTIGPWDIPKEYLD